AILSTPVGISATWAAFRETASPQSTPPRAMWHRGFPTTRVARSQSLQRRTALSMSAAGLEALAANHAGGLHPWIPQPVPPPIGIHTAEVLCGTWKSLTRSCMSAEPLAVKVVRRTSADARETTLLPSTGLPAWPPIGTRAPTAQSGILNCSDQPSLQAATSPTSAVRSDDAWQNSIPP